MTQNNQMTFEDIVGSISTIGRELHEQDILDKAKGNSARIQKSIKKLSGPTGKKAESAILISAGPSLYKKKSISRIKDSGYQGSIICVDGSYIACLKAGLVPDYVLTLDPHETRVVRWFGDHEFEKNSANDDYFRRQDLDVSFRENSIKQNFEHIDLVNKMGHLTKAIVATTAPSNVVNRIVEAKFDMYWWNPLVDDPRDEKSITRRLYEINKIPCFNTGGNVGTAAWVFAGKILKIPTVAVVGVDLGYYMDTPKSKTQTYYELINHLGSEEELEKCFIEYKFPLTGEKFYTDPTYFWYRKNLLDLISKADYKTYNCTEGGTFFHEDVECIYLDKFLEMFSK